MDEARAMLDALMGKTRDLPDAVRKNVRQVNFTDKEVCKHYICGLCPYLLFSGTKSDIGKCPSRHCGDIDADTCKKQWEQLPQHKKNKYGYEYDLFLVLDQHVSQCDRRIQRNKQRSDIDTPLTDEDWKKLLVLQKQIDASAAECEAAADADNMDRCYEIKKELDQLHDAALAIMNPNNIKRIDVCEVSGNFMSSRDNDERMRAHFEGKQYLAWKQVRAMHAELSKRVTQHADISDGGVDRKRTRSRSRSRSREYKSNYRRRSSSRDHQPIAASTTSPITATINKTPEQKPIRQEIVPIKVPILVSSELEEGEEVE